MRSSCWVIGLAIAWTRISQSPVLFPFRVLATVYTDIFRGVPLLLVVLLVGYGLPQLQFGFLSTQSPAVYGVVALTLTYSAYVAEVLRAGIFSVPHGQLLAARSLGLTQASTMRRVILPQAIRTVVPPLLNDFISLQKDTSLVSVLGAVEATRAAQIFASTEFNESGLVLAALFFLVLTIPMTRFTDRLVCEGSRPTSRESDVTTPSETVLELDSVVKRFGDHEVLSGVTVQLHRHEVVCLIGASGSGKSTLLRCANLLETIDAGQISLFGQSLMDPRIDPDIVRRHVGMVFQSFNLFPHLSVLDNVLLGPVRALKRKRADVPRRGHGPARAHRPQRTRGRVSGPTLWWSTATRCHRALARHAAGPATPRRGNERARPDARG